MSKFDELINSLKRDIQSLPSVDGRECVPVMEDIVVAAAPSVIQAQPERDFTISETSSKKTRYVRWFVRHGLLSVEFFFFFFILLTITKPSFLYYNERVVQNGRELLRTHFSFLYLISYSFFFTCIFHVLILIHKDLVKRY
jgi:hypothetical protein